MEVEKMRTYITNELTDAEYYTELSKQAPNDGYRLLLENIADDKMRHATELRAMYRQLTGKGYSPVIPKPVLDNSFSEMVRSRVLRETDGYIEYMREAMKLEDITEKDMLNCLAYDKNAYSSRLLYMLAGI